MLSVVDDARALTAARHAAWSDSFSELFAQVAGEFGNVQCAAAGRVSAGACRALVGRGPATGVLLFDMPTASLLRPGVAWPLERPVRNDGVARAGARVALRESQARYETGGLLGCHRV